MKRGKMKVLTWMFGMALLALTSSTIQAQGPTASIELFEYVNDSLGIRMSLPCTPEIVEPDILGSPEVLSCVVADHTISIQSSRDRPRDAKEFDVFLEREIRVEGTRVRVKKMRIQGNDARQVRFRANDLIVTGCIILRIDDLLMVGVVEPKGRRSTLGQQVIRSIKLN